MPCSKCGCSGHNMRTCSQHRSQDLLPPFFSEWVERGLSEWMEEVEEVEEKLVVEEKNHSSMWLFLNTGVLSRSIGFLLEYFDVPDDCQKLILDVCMPACVIPMCPDVVCLFRVHNTCHLPINTVYNRKLGTPGDVDLYYETAKTLYTPQPPSHPSYTGHHLCRIKKYKGINVQEDLVKIGLYKELVPTQYMQANHFGRGKYLGTWSLSQNTPAAVRKEEFWPEYRHYIHMCKLSDHQQFSTCEMYTKLVKKHGGRAHYQSCLAIEHVRIYKNIGGWRKNELKRVYPTLYGKDGWVKKITSQ